MAEPELTTALAHRLGRHGTQGLAVDIREVSDRGMIDVRGIAGDRQFAAAFNSVIGAEPPREPRTSVTLGDTSVLWLSVDQWLVTLPRDEAAAVAARLTEALSGVHSLVVDLSDARTILRLEGAAARTVLNKGTSVDFTTRDLGAGSVRRLRFAEIAAMVHVAGTSPDVLDLYVFRSYADYAWEFLVTAAKEAARVELFGRQPVPAT